LSNHHLYHMTDHHQQSTTWFESKYQLAPLLHLSTTWVGRSPSNTSNDSVSWPISENPQGENHWCSHSGRGVYLPRGLYRVGNTTRLESKISDSDHFRTTVSCHNQCNNKLSERFNATNIWRYDQSCKCFPPGKTTSRFWRSNIWSEHNRSPNEWTSRGLEYNSECEFELASDDLNLDQIVDSAVEWQQLQFLWVQNRMTWSNPQLNNFPLLNWKLSRVILSTLLGWKGGSPGHHRFSFNWGTRRGSSCCVEIKQRSHWLDYGWHQRTWPINSTTPYSSDQWGQTETRSIA